MVSLPPFPSSLLGSLLLCVPLTISPTLTIFVFEISSSPYFRSIKLTSPIELASLIFKASSGLAAKVTVLASLPFLSGSR